MDYLAVSSSAKKVGIALGTSVGAENITAAIGKTLAARGIPNVVVSLVEDPFILPFIAKSLAESCDVVLAIGVLGVDSKANAANLTSQLVEAGLSCGVSVVPGIMAPSNLLELKALLPACCNTWANSVSSILAVSEVASVPIAEIILEDVLLHAATTIEAVSADTTDLDVLLTDFRQSMKVRVY